MCFPIFKEYEYMAVSSAKLQTSVFLVKNVRSFMTRLNKIGPNIDPFGRISRYEQKVDLSSPVEDGL